MNVVKSNAEDQYILCVVYSPHTMPLRGLDGKTDLAGPKVLERAAWSWMAKGAKTGMWHKKGGEGEARCVENFIYRNPIPWDVNGDGTLIVRKGDWLAGFLLSDRAWGLFKSGQIGGVSLQGSAGRKPASAKALARVKAS